MAESFMGNVGEFLIGLFVIPWLLNLLWALAVPFFGLSTQAGLIGSFALSGVFALIFFYVRGMIGFGLLIATIGDIVIWYLGSYR